MKYASGNFDWLAGDTVGTTFTISGLPFQPKAIKVWIIALEEISLLTFNPNATEAVNGLRSMGFATSTTNRRCVAAAEDDGAGTMTCFSGFRDDCVAMTLLNNVSALASGRLDLDAMLSDGFRLIIDATSGTVNVTVQWEAWGEDGETWVAEAISIAEPAATGNQDYTVTGLTADGVGQAVMFAGVQQTGATPSETGGFDSGFCLGFAAGVNAADNVVVMGNQDTGSAAADTDGYCKTGECLGMIAVAGGNPSARAQLTQWNTNGFRLNWIARATTNRRYIALAIKGGLWKAGSYTIAGNTLNATATVSGLAFQPIGVSFIGRMTAEQAAGVSTAEDRMSIGQGSSPSSRQALGYLSENGTGTAEVDQLRGTVLILGYPSAAAAILAAYDLDAINADGFRVIVDTAGGVASEWQGFLAFGSEPVPFVDLTRDESVRVSSLASLLLTVGIPLEALRQFLQLSGIPIDTLAASAESEQIPIDVQGTPARDESIPIDVASNVVTVDRDASIPIESQEAIKRDDDIPIESQGTATRDESIPIESQGVVQRDDVIPIEHQGVVSRLDQIPIDVILAQLLDESIPIESIGTHRRDESIPIDTVFITTPLTRDESIPVDINAPPILLERDETVPIDVSLAPVPPFGFLVFLGGAGAPVWWLRTAPLLACIHHRGRIILFGRSQQRWRPAPRRAEIVLPVRREPSLLIQQVIPVRQTRQPMVYESQAVLWIGGRSRIRSTASPMQIERDDAEIIQLLMLS